MKKILSILTSIGLIITSTSSVLSCKTENTDKKDDNKRTDTYIKPVQDQRIVTSNETGEVSVKINIENKIPNEKLEIKVEPPKKGDNIYPQTKAITRYTINDDDVINFKWNKSNGYGQDIVTIYYGIAKPISFKINVFKTQYIPFPDGKGQSAFYDWKEANPNRDEHKKINKLNSNGFTYFSPYIDAALWSGDNVKEILEKNEYLDHLTFAFAAQDKNQTDKIDISFAGIAKNNENYDWYLNHKLKTDILQPLVNANIFKNTKTSYGGYNACQQPETYLPWVIANKLNTNDEVKAENDLETAFINFQKETSDLVNQNLVKSIDFDIEGLAQNNKYNKDNRLLAKTLASMIKKDPEWSFSLTLSVLPNGLIEGENGGKNILDLFIEEYSKSNISLKFLPKINLMTMDYDNYIYEDAINKGKTNYDLNVEAMISAKNQIIKSINKFYNEKITDKEAYSMMGFTSMIGVNDQEKGIFTLEDAKDAYNWAQNVGISYLSFWSINDDRGLSFPIYQDPNFPKGVLGGQPINKSQTSHGLIYLNEYDFTKVYTGEWD